ncbi:uncharacterized protein HKW66_Vig0057410 [Vigna angularis]|uniref:Uncharacterized protein n=1 Tax=Phaseolus angularis TaxID=3914 RepID=A0A8T0L902_PHAAN|nr:uncharacterized protein HKW66_Vig0057410 [Vigna angularis]
MVHLDDGDDAREDVAAYKDFVKNGDACLICGLGCCTIGVMVHEKRSRGCSVREDEQSFQAQATWQRVKRQAGIRRDLVVCHIKQTLTSFNFKD